MADGVDRGRLDDLLGGDGLGWLVDRAAQRLGRGRPLTGTVTLRAPTAEQRAETERLLGRPPGGGATLTVSLDEVDTLLRAARVCAGLREAVELLRGPVVDAAAQRAAEDAAWDEVCGGLVDAVAGDARLAAWAREVVGNGLLRRLAAGDPVTGQRLVEHALAVVGSLPAGGVSLPRFATATLGDAHALDAGRPEATLALRAATHLAGSDRAAADSGDPSPRSLAPAETGGAARRRSLWAAVGVLCDELSVSVLALNLSAVGEGLTDQVLRAHAAAGEPCRLTLGALTRHPAAFRRGERVFVCENVAVVEAASRELGARSAPLVCVEGQPSTAVRLVLGELAAAGCDLAYHGDFDWGGVRIAATVLGLAGGRPWRLTAVDYLAASGDRPLRGRPADTPWDPRLAAQMRQRGLAVEEETVLPALLADLSA